MWKRLDELRSPPRPRRPAPADLASEITVEVNEAGRVLDPGQTEVMDRLGELSALPDGLYLHGAVGRGKSWLADRLFEQLPEPKRRLHCHEFLADINAAIARRAKSLARSEPRETRSTSELIASVVAGCDYIMLDDFHVHDVADGELLFIVLKELAARGIFMLLTSNYPPDQLLPNPLFHDTFQPAIDLIEDRCTVIAIAQGRDHRKDAGHDTGFASGAWTTTGRGSAEEPTERGERSGRAITETFAQICERPWSAADYFALTQGLDRLTLQAVPAPADFGDDAFQRFAYLIDALADQDVRFDVESYAERSAFEVADNLPRDADRMLSRLGLLRAPAAVR